MHDRAPDLGHHAAHDAGPSQLVAVRRKENVRIVRAFSFVRSPLTNKHIERKHNMNQYHKAYTPEDSAIVFIDFQPQTLFGVANADRATMINNVTLLAKVAKEFKVPAVLTSVETESFSGYVWPQLLDIFPVQPVIER